MFVFKNLKTLVAVLFCFAIVVGCARAPKILTLPHVATDPFEGKKGCFLLYNVRTETFDRVVGEENCRERLVASSTFKVPLAVMAFDAGILKSEDQILAWDGKKDEYREVVNQDHDARSWMNQSIVWFSKRLTSRLGMKKVKAYLKKFEYGNQDMGGGLTESWLVKAGDTGAALKISAYEQAEFMKKLWMDRLPVSQRAMEIAQNLTYLETSPKGYMLHGKTGSNFYDADRRVRLGWFVGHLESKQQEYIVVTNFSDLAPSEVKTYGGAVAREITRHFLAEKGLW